VFFSLQIFNCHNLKRNTVRYIHNGSPLLDTDIVKLVIYQLVIGGGSSAGAISASFSGASSLAGSDGGSLDETSTGRVHLSVEITSSTAYRVFVDPVTLRPLVITPPPMRRTVGGSTGPVSGPLSADVLRFNYGTTADVYDVETSICTVSYGEEMSRGEERRTRVGERKQSVGGGSLVSVDGVIIARNFSSDCFYFISSGRLTLSFIILLTS